MYKPQIGKKLRGAADALACAIFSAATATLLCANAFSGGAGDKAPAAMRMETPLQPEYKPQSWEVTKARGRIRKISFTTTEGTWMGVDISPDSRTIVFDLLGHIYSLPMKGGTARSLTQGSGVALNYHPAISPDGRRIAFVSDRLGQDALWVMGINGENPRPLFFDPDSRIAEPRWLPSGKEIVAVRRLATSLGTYRTNDTIWIFPADGAPPRRLTKNDPPIEQPTGEHSGMQRWHSPAPASDGRYVYFNSADFMGRNRQILRADMKLDTVEAVTESPSNYGAPGQQPRPLLLGEAAPRPSPDGRFLAFVRKLPGAALEVGGHRLRGRSALWIRDLMDGTETIAMDPVEADQMSDLPMWKASPFPAYAWAPDGKSIVISQGGKIRRLMVKSGGAVTTIPFKARVERVISEQAMARARIDTRSFKPHYSRSPSVAPGRRELAIESVGRIWIRPLEGGLAKPLNAAPSAEVLERSPAWSPDGRTVAYVTSDGYRGGNIWIAWPGSNAPHLQLSSTEGRFTAPFWSPDGQWVYVSRWPTALDLGSGSWQLWRFAAGRPSAGEMVAATGERINGAFQRDGRIYYTRRAEWYVVGVHKVHSLLQSMKPDGSDLRQEMAVVGSAKTIAPSPDLKRVAIEQYQDVWAAPLSPGSPVDVLEKSAGVTRISTRGGVDPSWIDNETLVYASAGDYSVDSVARPVNERRPLGLLLDRDLASGKLALTNARLITVSPKGVIERGDVVIEDGRITCVGRCDREGARTIDLTGSTIMPGLVDLHAHSTRSEADFLPVKRPQSAINLAYGVTTIHDPFSEPDPSFTLSDLIESGRIVGPRTFSTGYGHLTRGRGWEHSYPILNMEDARNGVNRWADQGVLSLKDFRIGTRVQRQMYASAARERGVTVTGEGGEFPYTLGQIMDGVTGWEHPMALYPMYSDLIQFLGQAGAHYSNQLEAVGYPADTSVDYWLTQANVWEDPKLRAWMEWRELAGRRVFGGKPLEEYAFPIVARDMGRIMAAGGFTPLGSHSMVDGLGMHFELWSMASGAGPEMAVRAATLDGAHFLGLNDQIGSLETGKLADLVILSANPLEDIRNSTKIRFVMKSGLLRDAETLDLVWPRREPFGRAPWRNDQIYRGDVRRLDHWQENSTSSDTDPVQRSKKRGAKQ